MATFIRRGKTWRAQLSCRGVRDSATFDTKAQAIAWAADRESEIRAGALGKIIPYPVRKALTRYADEVSPSKKGVRWEKVRLKKFAESLPFVDRLLPNVTGVDIAEWRDASLKTTTKRGTLLAPSSVRREMVLLRSVFEIARKEWGWLAKNPMVDISMPAHGRPRDRRVSDDELDRILLALDYEAGTIAETTSQRVAVAFLWALETAMRAGEIVGLRPNYINVEGRYAQLPRSKNGDARKVPLSTAAVALLDCLPSSEATLFDLTSASIDALFRKATKRAEIVDLHWHDSRHEAITRLAGKLEILELARMVGTRDLKTLSLYFNATPKQIAEKLG
jgi:integrase